MTAKSKAESDVGQSTAGASGAAVGADQQSAGAVGGVYGESGNKQYADVAVEEAISTTSAAQANYTQLSMQRYLDRASSNQEKMDNMFFQHMQNCISTADMVAKDALRDRAVATDRIWNINEDSGFAVQLAAVVSAAVRESLKEEK